MDVQTVMAGAWKSQAHCADTDIELWVPPETRQGRDDDRIARERAVMDLYCMDCPVRTECVSEGVLTADHYANRGGFRLRNSTERRLARNFISTHITQTRKEAGMRSRSRRTTRLAS